jgi:uncharacterized membrane protein HdeD (DUF308 family)
MTNVDLASASAIFNEAMRASVQRHRFFYLLQAALMVIGGFVAILFPYLASATFVWLLGWLLIASGLVQGISLLWARNHPSFWLQLIPAVLGVVVGVLLLGNVGQGLLAITLLIIVFLMVEGISKIVFALSVRPLANWFLVLLSGILGIVLAVILWSNLPTTALWLLGLLLGIHLIGEGVALAALVWSVRKSA